MFSIPSVIFVSKKKKLLDKPDHRKKHKQVTPNLGGIAIFSAFAFVACVFNVGNYMNNWGYILGGAFLLFVTGLKDDLVTIDPYKKFGAQFLAAILIVFLANIRLNDVYGFLGFHTLPYVVSFLISIVGIAFVTNAFNLIDGVDGLAGSLCLLIFGFYGVMFGLNSDYGFAMISFSLAGAALGFLKFNINPAKIFMGDTGSLIFGFMVSVLSIAFVARMNAHSESVFISRVFSANGSLSVALAAIIVPVYDIFRVFSTRIARGYSPFHPDRTHIHHVLLDAGFNANQVALALFSTTFLFIGAAMGMSILQIDSNISIFVIVFIASVLVLLARKARNKNIAIQEAHLKVLEQKKHKAAAASEGFVPSVINPSSDIYEEKTILAKNPS
ncbi:MAG TPA: MraY family glycosyltransferase [Arachidicoccus sp.]